MTPEQPEQNSVDHGAAGLAALVFELGVLKRLRRAGWSHVGVRDAESVADHSLRVAQLASLIAAEEGADPARAALLAIWHDSQETRTGDIPHTARPYLAVRIDPQAITADQVAGLLTVVQDRFLLNSLRGEGFLNMRLTAAEAVEAVGIDPVRQVFAECVQSQPCLMERKADGSFSCSAHDTFFLPALLKKSPFWSRVEEGLRLFGVAEEDLTAVTCFRLDMVQRPRFTAELLPRTPTTPGTFGFLLGDAANAIHFWPGRGLNSGLASAFSLARTLAGWSGRPLRDADFVRHEALMAMLQYRHKSRAWRQMVTTDDAGEAVAIKDRIAQGITSAELGDLRPDADLDALMERLRRTRTRLEARLPGLPDDATLRAHLERLSPTTLHTLLVSGAWDSAGAGGEEVDVDWLLAPLPEPVGVTAAA